MISVDWLTETLKQKKVLDITNYLLGLNYIKYFEEKTSSKRKAGNEEISEIQQNATYNQNLIHEKQFILSEQNNIGELNVDNIFNQIKEEVISNELNINEKLLENINLNNYDNKSKIIYFLDKFKSYHSSLNEKFKAQAFQKAILNIKAFNGDIQNVNQLKSIQGLGKKILKKIEEVILTGKIRELEYLCNNINEKTKILQFFMTISGIGTVHANKFYNLGFRTLADLRNNQHVLNWKQKIGIKYHEDLCNRIPREECEKIFRKINECLFKVLPSEKLESLLLGSYIRGKSSSSDLDILIMRIDNESIDGILDGLIMEMNKKGYIKEILSKGKSFYDNYYFMSICKFDDNSPHRRIDINVNLRKYRAFAIMHYTGSQYFNKTLSLVARRLGFTLSEVGLSRVVRVHHQKVLYTDNIKCNTEEDIFKQLGLDYKTPLERDI